MERLIKWSVLGLLGLVLLANAALFAAIKVGELTASPDGVTKETVPIS
jgi:hypothetical protein